MATYTKRGSSYRIRASVGYTPEGKQVMKSKTWTPAPGMTERQIEKELNRQMVLFDDAMDVIRELKGRGYLVGVVTNGSASGQNHKLEKAGLKEILDDWVVSGDIGIHKPDPAIYRLAADRLHVACDECVFIGDLWQTDLYGACLAGMKPVWMNTEGSPVQEYKKIPQIRRLRELLELNF